MKRERLLAAARRLLERGELETAGVREVVAEARMSSRALYHAFASRDALILELAREMTEQFLRQLAAVPDPPEIPEAELPDRLLDPFVEVATPLVAFDGACLPRATDDELHKIRARMLEGSLELMFERFERSVRAGRLTALPDRAAFEIVLRGVGSLTAHLSRTGRLHELEGLRPSIRKLLVAQATLEPRPDRR